METKINKLTAELLTNYGYKKSTEHENLFYSEAENGDHDVIRFFPAEKLFNLCLSSGCYDFIDEKQLLNLLSK